MTPLEEFGEMTTDEKGDPLWVWKDGKGGYETLLKEIADPMRRKEMEELFAVCGGPQEWLDKLMGQEKDKDKKIEKNNEIYEKNKEKIERRK
ncbi:hypothetical protein K3495_g2301 [Podosphaera aphanis]|nr:hypothetical protein K3495_g2301 [Podosphaera aphanis]